MQPLLGFESVPISWGDPVSIGPTFKQDASNTTDEKARQWGMHNDVVGYFPISGSGRGSIVQNNKYTDDGLLFADGLCRFHA